MAPKNLNDLLHEVLATTEEGASRTDILLSTIRKYHFWPALQLKKFFNRSGLVLLHNTYKRTDVSAFQELYDECRSVVLDLHAPEGGNVVVSLGYTIPERMTIEEYKARMADTDVCEIGYEGTVIYVYEYNGQWYFGTSGCPTVDASRYYHPTKTHGEMLNEVLGDGGRDAFTATLDSSKAYSFVLVHHENRHVMNYAAEFDSTDYRELIHIGTRDRLTLTEDEPSGVSGVRYARKFDSPSDAIAAIEADNANIYCLIVKTAEGKTLKVSVPHIVKREECDLGNPNKWQNMLHVYMQNNPNYHITNYIAEYATDLVIPKNSSGRDMAPTYIIHTIICTMRDILYDLYVRTTTYNPAYGRFKMNKEADAALPPILRFHLAQLRNIQVSPANSHAFLTPRVVYQYLCFNQTMKNMRALINFFATNGGYGMNFRQAECFGVLNSLLQ